MSAGSLAGDRLTFAEVRSYRTGWSWRRLSRGFAPANCDVRRPEICEMKLFTASLVLNTEERTEFSDITKQIRDQVQQSPISTGIAVVNTLHTTCALFINEYQAALIEDLKHLVEQLVPERAGYRHDDPRFSDCERGNGHSHLRAALLGRSITIAIN